MTEKAPRFRPVVGAEKSQVTGYLAWSLVATGVVVAFLAVAQVGGGPGGRVSNAALAEVLTVLAVAAGLLVVGTGLLVHVGTREQRDMHRETRERLERLSDRLDRLDAGGPGNA